jgi:site-specific DNA recombinase
MGRKRSSAKTGPTRVIAYVRVSTTKQADEGQSLGEQEERLRALCVAKGHELVRVESDPAKSAATLKRPGLQRALAMLRKREADALAVVDLSRLTRSLRDLGTLLDKKRGSFGEGKAELISLGESIDTTSSGGRLILNVLGSVLQWERERASERTAAVTLHVQRHGRFSGGAPPFGWKLGPGGRLVPVAREQKVVVRARELAAEEPNLAEVTRQLAAEGVRTRSGRPPVRAQVERWVNERAYDAGLRAS